MTHTHHPLVSVIMPAYNAESTIAAAIESVCAQSMANLELIVLDDCSSDQTCEIVKQLAAKDQRIQFYPASRNSGVAAIRNKGIELSTGDYIALLDSDDTWHPKKLEKQLECLKNAKASLCYTSYGIVDDALCKIRPDYIVPEYIDYCGLLKENVIGCSTVLTEARVLKEHKFRTDFYHEDYVLWLELLKAGCKVTGVPEVLVNWRYQENSRSYNKWKSLRNRWKIYRQMEKLSPVSSVFYCLNYASAGLKKYMCRRAR